MAGRVRTTPWSGVEPYVTERRGAAHLSDAGEVTGRPGPRRTTHCRLAAGVSDWRGTASDAPVPRRATNEGKVVETVLIGLLAIVVGLALCFYGYAALRLVIAIWGAFAGFLLGAGVIAQVTGDGFLANGLAWLVGLGVALLFGLIAYLYYAVSVVLGMGAIGFALGTTLMAALGVSWSWLIVLVGVAVGVVLAFLAIAGDLPMLILAVLGAFAGSSVAITGALLLFGVLERDDLATPETTQTVALGWWWTVAYLVLAVVGLVVQLRSVEARRGTLRDAWAA